MRSLSHDSGKMGDFKLSACEFNLMRYIIKIVIIIMSVKKRERINFCQIVKVKTKALSMNIKCEDGNCQLWMVRLLIISSNPKWIPSQNYHDEHNLIVFQNVSLNRLTHKSNYTFTYMDYSISMNQVNMLL